MRRIIDVAIPDKNRAAVTVLAAISVGAAMATQALGWFDRWWSARIGEGVIYDLRVKLFDHIQRMPIGFFTRTQTGALISRLNNDVLGAQQALTSTLGSVVSNVVVLITTLTAMFLLQWQITLVALILLPIFIIPAKRVGRKMQAITRQGFELNADMNTQMTERFNVSGAQLVKLFGDYDREVDQFSDRAGKVRDIGVRRRHVRAGLLHRPGAGGGGGHRRGLRHRRQPGHLGHHQPRERWWRWPPSSPRSTPRSPALTNARVDIMSAVRVLRPGLRDRRPDQPHPGRARCRRPGRPHRPHRGRRRLVPLPRGQRGVARLARGRRAPGRCPTSRATSVLRGISAVIEPGQLVALVGPVGGGQDHPELADPPALRRDRRRHPGRRASTSAT